jgi:CheY-like chemotaxis protein
MNGTEKKILLVEDEPIAQKLYQNRLQREGFRISFAEDGELALHALSKEKPDLVVLDLMLPKINGPDVLKHIRTEERLKTTPVLIISNAYMSELSQKAMESGATRGMLKTECTPGRLVETVRDMLGYPSAFAVSDSPVTDDKQGAEFAVAAEAAMADEMSLKETREEFIQKAPGEVAKIRESCLAYVKVAGTPAGELPLNTLYKQVRFFATRAGLSGCVRIALLASAFEALLFEAVFKPGKATPSVAQTFAQAVDCLERLSQTNPGTTEVIPKAKILVVDDDAVCNLAMVGALKRAHFEPVSVDDPQKAIEMAQTGRYDVVFLDINMPVMNGFQVCERLRGMPEYHETPVIFITSFGDFGNRARSILSGGNDLIPKPISPVELVLKTTIRLLQPQSMSPEKTVSAAALRAAQNAATANGSADAAPVPLPAPSLIQTGANGANGTNGAHGGTKGSNDAPPVLKLAASENRVDLAKAEPPKESASAKNEAVPPLLKMKEEAPKVEAPKEAPVPPPLPVPTAAPIAAPAALQPENKPELPKPVEVKDEPKPVVKEEPKPVEAKVEQKPAEIKETISTPPAVKPASVSAPNKSVSKNKTSMDTKKTTIDEAARGVAQIIFGDENITDMNVRLTRIALERYTGGNKSIAEIARGVAQIIFGDENASDMNVRLTKIALERYNVAEVLGAAPADQKVVAIS